MLSKIWMPLDTFTEKAMEGLKEGKPQVPVGLDDPFKRYNEEGKVAAALAYMSVRKK